MIQTFQGWLCRTSIFLFAAIGQVYSINISRIEPAHWWIGMKNPRLQILFYGKEAGKCRISLKPGQTAIKLLRITKTANPDYLFADVEIGKDAKTGNCLFLLENGKDRKEIAYPLKARSDMAEGAAGFDASDVLYLIMPDRFANANPANDSPEGYLEKSDRNKPSGRHGGDLQGIENHLDYLKNLGISTLWLNPILENNQPEFSYHGYAITDYYKVDGRFGQLEDYKRLIRKCHESGLKMVQDMVANHIGTEHYWVKSIPDTGWIHYAGQPYTSCNFRIETIADPHAAASDRKKMTDGWFDRHMADLNQQHPLLATYLIQNTLWWIAETGIDGIRMDTWPYNDKDFLSRWCREVLQEFPKFSIVGEIWVEQPSFTSYFTEGIKNQDGYQPSLPSCTDFPFYFALTKGLQEKGNWDSGLIRLFQTLSQDFLYKDAARNLVFASNHDLSRFITTQGGDFRKHIQAMGIILTMRGIPQLYYGDEFALAGDGSQHSNVRLDFAGGWTGDSINHFQTGQLTGRTDTAFRFLQNLLRWRKTSEAITKGNFIHYLPEDNVYVYFRKAEKELVMVVVNGNPQPKTLKLDRFPELQQSEGKALEIIEKKSIDLRSGELKVDAQGIILLEIKN
jgi:glycosidase